jgi:hypothetical protein
MKRTKEAIPVIRSDELNRVASNLKVPEETGVLGAGVAA